MPGKYNRDEFIESFWAKVNKGLDSECWEWVGALHTKGYGWVKMGRRTWLAHRVSFALTNGRILNNLFVCHTCDNRKCVNPRHLFLGTIQDNQKDMAKKGRSAFGDRNPKAKLKKQQVIEIIRKFRTGKVTQKTLANNYGVSRAAIYLILSYTNWKRVWEEISL